MRVRVLVQALGALAIPLLALIVLWLPSIGQASPLEPVAPRVDPSLPDPRWLALVQETQPLRVNSELASAPSINLNLTTFSVAGRVATGATVVVSVTRAGSLVAYATASPLLVDADYVYVVYPTGLGDSAAGGGGYTCCAFEAGDVVSVSQASTSVSMTVPTLTALADAITNTVYGSAPVSQTVTAYVFPFAAPDLTYARSITADEAGRYQVSFAPTDLFPRDSGYVAFAQATDRRAYVRFVAPLLRAQVGGHELSGYAAPNSSVSIVAADAQGIPYNSPYSTGAGNDGSFRIGSEGWNGPNPLQPGDRITATAAGQTFVTTVLNITAQADLANGQVRGQAPAGLTVDVLRFSGPIQSGYDYVWSTPPTDQVTATATLTGEYTATLRLVRPDYGAALVTAPDGNQTFARFNVPYMRVRMGEGYPYTSSDYWLSGQVDDLAAPITVAIQGPSGYLKDFWHVTAYGNGFFGDYLQYADWLILDSGDVITLTTPRGIQMGLTLPLLTAYADPISDTVYGLAPPDSRLTITIYSAYIWPPQPPPVATPTYRPAKPYTAEAMEGLISTPTPTPPPGGGGPGYPQYTLVVTATALGKYRADLSQWINITRDSMGEVQWTTPDGNTVVRLFRATPTCQPRLQTTQVGGNILQFVIDGQQCASIFTVRLRDPQGQIKYESTYTNWSGYISSALYDRFGRPIPILPGDSVEIESVASSGIPPAPTPTPWVNAGNAQASSLLTIPIPSLIVTLDPMANTVSGQAPPGAVLNLAVYHSWAGQYESLTATASAQGVYSASLSSPLQTGDLAYANIPSFYAIGVLPVLQTTLYGWSIGGLLPPLSPYTVSLASSHSITAEINGYADNGGNWFSYQSFEIQPGDRLTVTTPSQALHLTLPFLSADVDQNTATVHGQAPPNSRLQVFLAEYPWNPRAAGGWGSPSTYGTQIVTATASGFYTATFPNLAPLQNAYGTLTHLSEQGHQTRLDFSAAQWNITLGSQYLDGYAGVAGVPYTVTLVGASGATKGIAAYPATGYSGYFFASFTSTVEAGDQLTLTRLGGLLTFAVPELTARHDYARQVLEGQSSPNAAISAQVPFGNGYSATRHTQADASGRYGLDTSDLPVQLLESGYVWLTDQAGDTVQRYFIIEGYRAYLPCMLRTPPSGN
jgi:hypothetical protein